MHDSPRPHPDPDVSTYRVGAYVIDTRTATLAQIMGTPGPRVQVRAPGGGREWEVPPQALRLATRGEREAAGVRGVPRSPVGCAECAELEAVRRAAVGAAAVDAVVAVRSHFRDAHLLPAGPW
ncbi:hypothetical protein [Streptomyces sp. NPDC046261]|uniref:hypothetical protein n=1 Tax=Streptomyces sp. NPDC046261 TaxID=3157200 RepID=UPI0033F33019